MRKRQAANVAMIQQWKAMRVVQKKKAQRGWVGGWVGGWPSNLGRKRRGGGRLGVRARERAHPAQSGDQSRSAACKLVIASVRQIENVLYTGLKRPSAAAPTCFLYFAPNE